MYSPPPQQLAIEAARQVGLESLKIQLNLTPEQQQTVTKVLDDYGKYYQNIEDDREDVAEHGRRRILAVLNEQQKKRFNEIFGQAPH
jgi:S-adenosylmethionine hydrolase